MDRVRKHLIFSSDREEVVETPTMTEDSRRGMPEFPVQLPIKNDSLKYFNHFSKECGDFIF